MPTYCPPPERLDLLQERVWSYSSIETFQKCPFTFYLKYGLDDRREAPNAFFGSAVHKYAEEYVKGTVPDKDKIFQEFKVPEFEQGEYDYSIDNLHSFVESTVLPYEFKTELEYNLTIGPRKFVCIFDLLVFREDKVHLYDYKTSKSTRYVDKYRVQMAIYKRALMELYPGKEIMVTIVFPRLNRTQSLNDLDLNDADLLDQIDEILACRDFQPKTSKLCPWCEYKHNTCPVFNPPEDMTVPVA